VFSTVYPAHDCFAHARMTGKFKSPFPCQSNRAYARIEEDIFMNNLSFSQLNLSREVLKAIGEMGFEETTPIQSQSIPSIFAGRDVIGQAQTGTGKTCAFGIPVIEKTDPRQNVIQGLILCPTRELAIQTAVELKNVAKYKKGIQILPVYGGQSMDRQLIALKKNPQIIIGTPGRVMDHMRRKTLNLSHLKMMVLDEADEMLNMGFREDIDIILEQIPMDRQTIFFSATMPKAILDLTARYQNNPVRIQLAHKELTVPKIEQYYLEVREAAKLDTLTRIIDANHINLALVFCNTKKRVDEVALKLQSLGYQAEALHGDMRQAQRDQVMAKFRKGIVEVLIATDVAARGIDVDNIEAVFNFDLPSDEEYYVHRIGRTGRAGKTGKSYTFVFGRELSKLKEIERYTRSKIMYLKPPTQLDVEEKRMNKIFDSIKTTITEGGLAKHTGQIEKWIEESTFDNEQGNGITTLDIAAALLKMTIGPGVTVEAAKDTARQNSPVYELADSSEAKKMVRLFINAGTQDGLQKKLVTEGISNYTRLPQELIGNISIYTKFTFVDVPREYADEVLISLKRNQLNGRKVNIEKANRPATKPRTEHNLFSKFKKSNIS
jgi:ATP-dependent RNA helicase DeaD